MTEPTDFEQTEAALPGMGEPTRGESPLRLAARRTIGALESAGFLDERHAVLCQLMLDMAEVVDAGRRGGKAAAAAMAAAQLQAAYVLMCPEDRGGGEGDDDWRRLVAELRRSAAPARDETEPASQE